MKKHFKFIAPLLFSACALTVSSSAFASCDDMGSPEWNELSAQMAQAYDQGNYDEALVYGKRLTLICNRSPIVNFTISEIYRNLENEQESYNYAKRATEYLQDYPVPLVIAEKMWMRRAENELPYKRQLEDLQNQLATGTGEVGSQQTELKTNLYTSEMKLEHERQRMIERYNGELNRLNTVKWIGAGTAIGGLVLSAVGAGLIGANYKSAEDKFKSDWEDFDKKDAKVHGGIALLAGGLGLGIAGSAVAIYGFLKERDVNQEYDTYLNRVSEESGDNPTTTAYQFNVDVSLGSVAVGMTF